MSSLKTHVSVPSHNCLFNFSGCVNEATAFFSLFFPLDMRSEAGTRLAGAVSWEVGVA